MSRYGYEPRQYKLASVYCFNCGLKLCQEADFLLHLPGSNRSDHVRTVYVSKIWDATVNTIASHNNKISSITNSGLDDPSSDIDNVTKLALEELTVRNQVEYQEHSNNNSSNNNNRYGNTGSPQKSPAEAFLATQSPSPTRQAAPSARIGQGLKTPTPSPSIANTTSTYETNPFNFMKNSAITFDRTMIFRLDAELSKAKSTSESYFTSDIVEIEYAYYKCKQFLLTQAMISFSNSLDMPSIQRPSGKVELSKADEEAVLFHIQSLGYNVNVSPAERSQLIRSFLSSSEATTLSFEVKNVVAENQATASIHTTVASRMITNTNNKKDIKPDILMDAVFGYADSPVSPLYTEAPSSLSSGFAEGMSNMLTGATGASAIALYVPMKCTVSGYRKYGAVGAVGGFLGGVCIGPLMATSYMLYGTGIGFRQMGRGIAGIKPPAGDTDGTSNSKRRRPSGTVVKGSITTNEPDSDEDDDDDGDDTMDLTDDIDDQISDTNTTISTMPDSARRNQFIFDEPATSTLFSYTGIDSSSAILTHLDLYIEQDIHADNDIADDPLRRKSVLEDYL